MSYAKAIIFGNLTRDPELKFTPSGMAIATFDVAVNRKWKSEAGEPKEEVSFFSIKAFGKTAETAGQYLKKGQKHLFDCRPQLEQWEDKQTQQKKSRVVFVVEQFVFGNNLKDEGAAATTAPVAQPAQNAQATPTATTREFRKPHQPADMPPPEEDENSIPF